MEQWEPSIRLLPPIPFQAESYALARKGAPAADISREGRAWQGRAGARGQFLILAEIKMMRKPHSFTFMLVLRATAAQ